MRPNQASVIDRASPHLIFFLFFSGYQPRVANTAERHSVKDAEALSAKAAHLAPNAVGDA